MLYAICRFFVSLYMRILFKFKVEGAENIPKEGALIVCSNHISNFDPVSVVVAVNRRLRYLAKKELFGIKGLGWLLSKVEMIPVDRTKTDMSAFKTAVKVLKNNDAIGIFAEGTRSKDGEMGDAKAGVALFAVKGRANVLPVYISGDYTKFKPITVKIGKVIDFSENFDTKANTETLHKMTDTIVEEIKKLKS